MLYILLLILNTELQKLQYKLKKTRVAITPKITSGKDVFKDESGNK